MSLAGLVGASVIGAILFLLPYLGVEPPGGAIAASAALGTVVAFGAVELGARRLDAKGIALLAAIAALAAAMRLALVTGIAGFSPFFLLVLCAGYTFGPSYGFLAGTVAMLVSAIVTGGIGPWLPYQMFASGWVGMGAGFIGEALRGWSGRISRPTRRDLIALAGYGFVAGFVYGIVMDLWDWAFFQGSPDFGFVPGLGLAGTLARFGQFYLLTSFGYDAFRAVGNALLVLALGTAVLATLARLRARASFEIVPIVDPSSSLTSPPGLPVGPTVPRG
jgi:energy-coupling factor transport system substrate-specific component